jgi:hypothetical protein
MKSILNQVIKKTATDYNLPVDTVKDIYYSYWQFIRKKITELPLSEVDEEQFKSLRTNFNIPFIGKLYTGYDIITKHRKQLNYYISHVKVKKNQTNV